MVEVFKYLGWLIVHNDADTQAMRLNLRKAQGCRAWILHVLWAENASPHMCGMFIRQPCRWFCYMGVKRGICSR
jgi:hypothetical protein